MKYVTSWSDALTFHHDPPTSLHFLDDFPHTFALLNSFLTPFLKLLGLHESPTDAVTFTYWLILCMKVITDKFKDRGAVFKC
jgi:hypothetical protein